MSLPINRYPSRGDREVIPQGLPAPSSAGPQPEGTHSSLVRSVADAGQADAEGAQWNDDEDNSAAFSGEYARLAPKDYDPNMSGPRPTEPALDPLSGVMGSWQENDDYRDFTYDTENVPESRLLAGYCYPTGYRAKDGDYDDNGGYNTSLRGTPSMVEHSGAFGSDETAPCGSWEGGQSSQGGISIEAVIRR